MDFHCWRDIHILLLLGDMALSGMSAWFLRLGAFVSVCMNILGDMSCQTDVDYYGVGWLVSGLVLVSYVTFLVCFLRYS